MSFYMFQWRYKDAALKAMVQHPQDRSGAMRCATNDARCTRKGAEPCLQR